MIELPNLRVGRLTLRISGIAASAVTVITAWAAIRSVAEWQGLKTVAHMLSLSFLCVAAAIVAGFCFTHHQAHDAGHEERTRHDPRDPH